LNSVMADGEGVEMKVATLFSSIILSLILFTGQARADWVQVATNVERIVALEDKVGDISSIVRMIGSSIGEDGVDQIRVHGDIYFVYYLAANVALANGEMEDFEEYLEMADDELDRMLEIVDEAEAMHPEIPEAPEVETPESVGLRTI